jgi:hypothetical protein
MADNPCGGHGCVTTLSTLRVGGLPGNRHAIAIALPHEGMGGGATTVPSG